MKRQPLLLLLALGGSVALGGIAPAVAGPELQWRGTLSSDLRLYTNEELNFERSESTAQVQLNARLNQHIAAVGHVAMVFTERANVDQFSDLYERDRVDPLRFESDALFVDFIDVAEGLDIRVGRQQLIWGSADRFHPTSNLNPLDVEDPVEFGKVIANEMVTLSFNPDWSVGGDEDEGEEPAIDDVGFQLVLVPFFKPAQLPATAQVAFTERRVFKHRANTPLVQDLVAQQKTLEEDSGWVFNIKPRVSLPERKLENVMFGGRITARILDIDLGVSYFRGFDDFPRAETIIADTDDVPRVGVNMELTYPRVQVVGFDAATSLDFLDGLGLWAEVGITYHDDLYRVISTGPAIGVNAIEREYDKGSFVKAVVGMDYTPVDWLYLNVQYLRGFVDEFGDRMLENYIVAGGDFKIAYDAVLFRFFNIFNLNDGSFALYPMLAVRPWVSGEISIGGFIFSSAFSGFDETRKFDSRAVGDSSVFLQVRAWL